jgi:NADH dehydrogenase/NADH:ubiquinone oxidoreductase subunit G
MTDQVTLTIDDQTISVPAGTTILKAASRLGIEIPTICYHSACTSNALCRICVVDVEGSRTLVASCVAIVTEGMKVHTLTERVLSSRKTILEMLAASVDLSEAPEILNYLAEYQANTERFPAVEERKPAIFDDNSMYIRDYAKCILCWRCVQVCAQDSQYTFAINFNNRGYETQIGTFYDKSIPETTCVFCGQCIGVCPTGALKPKRQWLLESGYDQTQIMDLTKSERKQRTRQLIITKSNTTEV